MLTRKKILKTSDNLSNSVIVLHDREIYQLLSQSQDDQDFIVSFIKACMNKGVKTYGKKTNRGKNNKKVD